MNKIASISVFVSANVDVILFGSEKNPKELGGKHEIKKSNRIIIMLLKTMKVARTNVICIFIVETQKKSCFLFTHALDKDGT